MHESHSRSMLIPSCYHQGLSFPLQWSLSDLFSLHFHCHLTTLSCVGDSQSYNPNWSTHTHIISPAHSLLQKRTTETTLLKGMSPPSLPSFNYFPSPLHGMMSNFTGWEIQCPWLAIWPQPPDLSTTGHILPSILTDILNIYFHSSVSLNIWLFWPRIYSPLPQSSESLIPRSPLKDHDVCETTPALP